VTAWSLSKLSFRAQIGLLTSAVAILVSAMVGLGAVAVSRNQTVELIRADLQAVARTMADRLGGGVNEKLREISLLGDLEPLSEIWSDAAQIRSALELLQQATPTFAWIGFADKTGKVIAATERLLEGKSAADRPWFVHGLIGNTIEDVHEAKLLANLLRDRAQLEPLRFFDVASPVYNAGGELVGVLGAHINWEWASELRTSTLAADSHPDTKILIVRRDGTAILGGEAPDQKVLTTEQAAYAYRTGAGAFADDQNVSAFAVMRGREGAQLGWIVVAQQPAATALAPLTRLTATIAALGLGTGLLGLLAAGGIARRLSQPLHALADEADQIGRDPGKTMIHHQHGSAEIEQLSASLRSLLRRLGLEEEKRHALEEEATETVHRLAADIRELKALAHTDPLTGLLNRRSFMEVAERAMRQKRTAEMSAAVFVIDIDHFKLVNDTFGHAVGDETLKHVAETISAALREKDRAARFGGEEFVALVQDVSRKSLAEMAERVRGSVSVRAVLPNGDTVTVSIGAAMILADDIDIEKVIERADQELYRAKLSGRNRVCISPVRSSLAA
jgi:diguanylate cyclase (GGDEF)-like protein